MKQFVLVFVLALAGFIPSAADAASGERELIVKFRSGTSALQRQAVLFAFASSTRPAFPRSTPPEQSLVSAEASLDDLILREVVSDELAKAERRVRNFRELVDRLTVRRLRSTVKQDSSASADLFVVRLRNGINANTARRALSKLPSVEYADLNHALRASAFPESLPNDVYVDPDQNGSWSRSSGLPFEPGEDLHSTMQVGADRAWRSSQGKRVIVAVIDSGFDALHEDFSGAIWRNLREDPTNGIDDDANGYIDDYYGFNFVDSVDANQDGDYADAGDRNIAVPFDDNGHGSHVAGTIAARGNNGLGIIGVAPKAAIMALKVVNRNGESTIRDTAAAIMYAVDNGADIINLSLGGAPHQTVAAAVSYAEANGVAVVAAAGNSNADASSVSPANIASVIAVGALYPDGTRADFSNYGNVVDVAAPGWAILSIRAGGTNFGVVPSEGSRYAFESGTSFAAPHVTGIAALILAMQPTMSMDELRNRIRSGVTPISVDRPLGSGRVDAGLATSGLRYSWHNAARPCDVNRDNFITNLDALAIVAEKRKSREINLPDGEPEFLIDVNNDGYFTNQDALTVISCVRQAR